MDCVFELIYPPFRNPTMSKNEGSQLDPAMQVAKVNKPLEKVYIVINGFEKVPIFPNYIIPSNGYSFWYQHELPSNVPNPWKVDPMDADSTDEHNQYIEEHTGDVAYLLYRIEGGTFTSADIFKSPSYNDNYSETIYTVTVSLTINGKPAKYTLSAYFNWKVRGDEIPYRFCDVEFSGFPENISVGFTEPILGYLHINSTRTWGLRGI